MNQQLLQPMPFPTRVVSLRESASRRADFCRRADAIGLTFEFFDAVGAESPEVTALMSHGQQAAVPGRQLGPREIACALSHRHLYRATVKGGHAGCLIFEDDVEFAPALSSFIARMQLEAPALADKAVVIHLGGREGFEHRRMVTSTWNRLPAWDDGSAHRVVASERALQRTCGYYITRSACMSILRTESSGVKVADAWDDRLDDRQLSAIWVTNPPLVYHPRTAAGSLIEDERLALFAEHKAFLEPVRSPSIWRRMLRVTKRRLLYPVLHLMP